MENELYYSVNMDSFQLYLASRFLAHLTLNSSYLKDAYQTIRVGLDLMQL